jgi:hypothetical protein
MEAEVQQKGGTFWTEILELDDQALKQKINAECKRDEKKTTLEMIRDYFIYQSYQDYFAKYQMYGKRLFGFYNKKIKKPPIFADKAE